MAGKILLRFLYIRILFWLFVNECDCSFRDWRCFFLSRYDITFLSTSSSYIPSLTPWRSPPSYPNFALRICYFLATVSFLVTIIPQGTYVFTVLTTIPYLYRTYFMGISGGLFDCPRSVRILVDTSGTASRAVSGWRVQWQRIWWSSGGGGGGHLRRLWITTGPAHQ